VEGATADDYKGKVVELPDGTRVLVGIRFQGLDLDKPFVEVMRQSAPLTNTAQTDALIEVLRERFAVFGPARLCVHLPSHARTGHRSGPDATEDVRYLAAPVARIKRLALPDHYERVGLERASSLSFYTEYEAVYRQLLDERPWLLGVARQQSKEDLESYRSEGTIFEVSVDGEWSGIVAAFRAPRVACRATASARSS
jgi:hypothetical protein